MTTSVRRQVASGAAWVILTRTFDRGLGFISTLVLARLLVPADFGLLALAMSVVYILDLLRRFGFDILLVTKLSADRDDFDTVWTLNLIFSLTVSALLLLAAGPAAAFYDEPGLAPVVRIIALFPAIEGLQNIGVVNFQKELRFDREFRYLAGARLTGFLVTIPLAFLLRDHWALVIGLVCFKAAQCLLSYLLHPYRPRLSLAAARQTLGFSSWIVLNNAVQFLVQRSPDFVIGKLLGVHALGLFSLSYEIGYLTSSDLSAPINRAVFPGYAKRADDPDALGRGLLEVVSLVTLVIAPLGIGLACVADLAVPVVLGEKWRAAIPLVSLLAVYGAVKAVSSNTMYIFLVKGRPWLLLMLGIMESLILLPLLIWGVAELGLFGACWAYLAAVFALAPVAYGLALREVGLKARQLLARMWRPLMALGVMTLVVRQTRAVLPISGSGLGLLDELLVLAGVGAFSYGACVLGLWKLTGAAEGAERTALDAIAGALRYGREAWRRRGGAQTG